MSSSNHDSPATKKTNTEHVIGTDNEDIFDVLYYLAYGNKEERNTAEKQFVLFLNKNPEAAKKRNRYYKETPLHIICHRNEEIKVETQRVLVTLLLEKYADAVKEKDLDERTPLHVACFRNAPVEVISYLLETYAAAAMEIDKYERTPLHLACVYAYDAVPLLLRSWPDAAKVKDALGELPLHWACSWGSCVFRAKVVSSLLDCWPDAIMEKAKNGDIPLHMACKNRVFHLQVVKMLLEKWPEAVLEKNDDGKTPADYLFDEDENGYKIMNHVSQLCEEKVDATDAKEMIDFFMQEHINWRGGVALVFKNQPAIAQTLDLDTNIMPEFLHFVGSQCELSTMYEVVRNQQDLFSDV